MCNIPAMDDLSNASSMADKDRAASVHPSLVQYFTIKSSAKISIALEKLLSWNISRTKNVPAYFLEQQVIVRRVSR